MKSALSSALLITLYTFLNQLLLFFVQILTANIFGTGVDLDAFLAASTLPQYFSSIFIGTLSFVLVPYFIQLKSNDKTKMQQLSMVLFNNCIVFLGILTILGIVLSKPILRLSTPGLNDYALELGSKVAIIVWPSVLFSGLLSLLTGIYQAERKFGWPAFVPVIGSFVNLVILINVSPYLGVVGLALSTTIGLAVQIFLLSKILFRNVDYQFDLGWDKREVVQIARLLVPLLAVSVVTKFTPVVERFLASGLPEGSISEINYAFKIISIASVLISIGGSTVVFNKMASEVANSDFKALRKTLSFSLRFGWIIAAPIVTIGISLSLPTVIFLFNRGEFTLEDAVSVSDLLKFYLIALIGMSLGNYVSRVFYALSEIRLLAVFSFIEVILYFLYSYYLTLRFGITGIVIGYVIYFNFSLVWQLLILKMKLGGYGHRQFYSSVLLTPHWNNINPLEFEDGLFSIMRNGMFNAGFIGAAKNGIPAMKWWAGMCHYKMDRQVELGIYDDQKYLDLLPVEFPGSGILRHQGCNLASWNIDTCKREIINGKLMINKIYEPVFIHFAKDTITNILNRNDELLKPYLDEYIQALQNENFDLLKNLDNLDHAKFNSSLYSIKHKLRLRTRLKRFLFRLAEKL